MVSLCLRQLLALVALAAAEFPGGEVPSHDGNSGMREKASLLDESSSDQFLGEQYPPQQYSPQQYRQYPPQQYAPQQG